jgi:SAM-dependent methyltransferase
MKNQIKRVHHFLSVQFGVDLIKILIFLGSIPWYVSSLIKFRKQFNGKIALSPYCHDRRAEAGSMGNEYFIQDLIVAQLIHEARPNRHLDIGSRIDGFVAHVASFRKIEVIDIRPLSSTSERITFLKHDIMEPLSEVDKQIFGCVDSISCLHALEHFGLGRYGDNINSKGWRLGLRHIAQILEPGGRLYLATPVGIERVLFNANWIFNPFSIVHAAHEFKLRCTQVCQIKPNETPSATPASKEILATLSKSEYTLCLFVFDKDKDSA